MSFENLNPTPTPDTGDVQPVVEPGVSLNGSVPQDEPEAFVTEPHGDGVNGTAAEAALNGQPHSAGRFAKAGRKGALRVHQLIREGLLYEQEHGLKRGRQRLRQLIEQGKRYEEEHGLAQPRARKRAARMSSDKALAAFLESLVRLVKPSVRAQLARVLAALEAEPK